MKRQKTSQATTKNVTAFQRVRTLHNHDCKLAVTFRGDNLCRFLSY